MSATGPGPNDFILGTSIQPADCWKYSANGSVGKWIALKIQWMIMFFSVYYHFFLVCVGVVKASQLHLHISLFDWV